MASITYGSYPSRLDDLLGSLDADSRGRVRLLTSVENKEFESVSLNRLPQTSWGEIDWEHAAVIEQWPTPNEVDAAIGFAQLVRRYVRDDSDVVLFWGNLVVPSVAMPASMAAASAEEILGTSHDIWLFAVDAKLLIEYFHEGRLTVANIPADSVAG